MSTNTVTGLSQAIQTHNTTVVAEHTTLSEQTATLTTQKDAILSAVASLRGMKLTDPQKGAVDQIDAAAQQVGTSVSTIKASADALKTNQAVLAKIVPNTPETPFVSTGTSGSGTATRPGTDSVQEDTRYPR